jgi:hypothetical protein
VPLIIVEGVDGSGKTTLIQNFRQVASRLCWIFARSGPPQSVLDLDETIRYLSRNRYYKTPLITDRHPLISEPIYGPIIRGKSLIEEYWDREEALDQIAAIADRVIYCRPDLQIALRSSKREPQMPGVHEQYWALYQAYDKAMEDLLRRKVKVLPYDWSFDQSVDLNQLFLGSTP